MQAHARLHADPGTALGTDFKVHAALICGGPQNHPGFCKQASQFAQVVATDGSGTVFLGGSVDSGTTGGGAIYLRTYDLATGDGQLFPRR